jgi:hypothetical protein
VIEIFIRVRAIFLGYFHENFETTSKYFLHDFLDVSRINRWLHPNIFFNFFKACKDDFRFLKKARSLMPRSQKSLSLYVEKEIAHDNG